MQADSPLRHIFPEGDT